MEGSQSPGGLETTGDGVKQNEQARPRQDAHDLLS